MSSYLGSTFGPNSPLRKAALGLFSYGEEEGGGGETPPPQFTDQEIQEAMGDDEEADKLASGVGGPETPAGKRRRKTNELGEDDVRDKTFITPAGETYSTQEHPAAECPASMFRLRVGPDYRRTGKKDFSGPALFKLEVGRQQ